MAVKSHRLRRGEVRAAPSLVLLAGPCVIESREGCLAIAARLARLARAKGIPLVFKASYDKANRSSLRGLPGPGARARP